MPYWTPDPVWKDQDVFIIGGGVSLETFDWELLKPDDVFTIGCNDAYLRGPDICNVCFFGDKKWWKKHQHRLETYRASGKGVVFTHCPQLQKDKTSWLWMMSRESRGLHHNALAWNKNTGAGAVNLALLLGARRVFLLGFDMHLTGGRSNWHDNTLDTPNEKLYPKFIKGWERLAKDLSIKFPGCEIFNITDNSSLDLFPKIGVDEFWSNRMGRQNIAAKIGA